MAGHSTTPDVTGSLVAEVVALCRRGLRHADPPESPGLRRLLGIPEEFSSVQALPLLRESIMAATITLAEEVRRVFQISSGADLGSTLPREKRLEMAARAERISTRTARRWSEEKAPPQIVAHLLRSPGRSAHHPNFDITQLHARLNLSIPTPILCLERTIRIRTPWIDRFYEEISIRDPREGTPVWRELDGCALEKVTDLGSGMWGASFTFPHPLPVGATHTFSTSLRFPSRKCLLPEFAFRPHSTTLNARIDIYFGNRLPSLIEVFETTGSPGQVPSPHVTEALIPRHPIQHFEFPEIQRGLGVGVRWLFNDQHRARIPAGVTL